MRALIFIQTNDGVVHYKCDTFWSTSPKVKHAKVYSSDNQKNVDDWITPFDYNIKLTLEKKPELLQEILDKYDGCKMGYRNVDDSILTNNGSCVKEDTTDEQLRVLNFTHEMTFDKNIPIISDIRKRYIREEKLNEILK